MRKIIGCLVVLVMFVFAGSQVLAAEQLIESVKKGCSKELTTYCKEVTPGEGRVIACLYAFSDKLTPQCEYALYDAAAQLERAVTALAYVANECRTDLTSFCSDIQPGQGRLLQCIDKNNAKISSRCKQAMKEVGIKK